MTNVMLFQQSGASLAILTKSWNSMLRVPHLLNLEPIYVH